MEESRRQIFTAKVRFTGGGEINIKKRGGDKERDGGGRMMIRHIKAVG